MFTTEMEQKETEAHPEEYVAHTVRMPVRVMNELRRRAKLADRPLNREIVRCLERGLSSVAEETSVYKAG